MISKHRAGRTAGAFTILGALFLAGCAAAPEGRVLIIGIDGASPLVMDRLLESGRLPVLGELAASGTYGPLENPIRPILSPVVWTTVATGKEPGKHGIDHFVWTDDQGRRRLYQSRQRRSHALWNIVSDHDSSVLVVNWWITSPPEVVNGIMVSEYALPELRADSERYHRVESSGPAAPTIYPEEESDRVRSWLMEPPEPSEPPNPFDDADSNADGLFFEQLTEDHGRDLAVTRVSGRLVDEKRPSLAMVLLTGIDRASHILWRHVEPDGLPPEQRPTEEERAAGRALLESYYELTDRLIGFLVSSYDLDRDLIIVLSDHGMEPGSGFPPGRHETDRAADGVLFVAGRGVAPGSDVSTSTILDITPTVLAWMGLPAALDMDGGVMTALFDSDDATLGDHGTVATHDLTTIRHMGGEDSEDSERLLEELKALGYID